MAIHVISDASESSQYDVPASILFPGWIRVEYHDNGLLLFIHERERRITAQPFAAGQIGVDSTRTLGKSKAIMASG